MYTKSSLKPEKSFLCEFLAAYWGLTEMKLLLSAALSLNCIKNVLFWLKKSTFALLTYRVLDENFTSIEPRRADEANTFRLPSKFLLIWARFSVRKTFLWKKGKKFFVKRKFKDLWWIRRLACESSYLSRFGDDMRVLSAFCSSSKNTFIITMSPVESVWLATSLEPVEGEVGVM